MLADRSGSVPAMVWDGVAQFRDLCVAGNPVRVIGRFEGFSGRYPVHCHILDHEDCEMMRFFNVA